MIEVLRVNCHPTPQTSCNCSDDEFSATAGISDLQEMSKATRRSPRQSQRSHRPLTQKQPVSFFSPHPVFRPTFLLSAERLRVFMALKVIGAGQSRTGTLSLKFALEHLGFGLAVTRLNFFRVCPSSFRSG
ncbi:MAG: hypothetical protein IPN84_17850 [Sphingomonadales bacterium]|nr:hypothetical protein [Sphingomonadales bacterium]